MDMITASADRRPVDPPPVVRLSVFESDPDDNTHGTDITFPYNANFVLYASLEYARPMAQPRGAQSVPVLTGVPVAAVAYLDRPEPAGYFIFPDLSVRHEGYYKLNFHLYEEIKDPKDVDKDGPISPVGPATNSSSSNPTTPTTFLNFRLQVNSNELTVYSAKKFPGLSASTQLSRVIAEQGCRVRIRRDVRMRRRGEKRGEEYDLFSRRDKYFTPDPYTGSPVERPRSSSSSTVDPAIAYTPDAQRRPSIPDYGFQYAQPYPRRMVPAPPLGWAQAPAYPPYQSHLAFGSGQFQGPQLPPTPPPVTPAMPYSPQVPYYHTRHRSNGSEYESAPPAYSYHPPPMPAEPPSYPKAPEVHRHLQPLKPLNVQPYGESRPTDCIAYPSATPPAMSRPPSNMTLPPCKTLEAAALSKARNSISSVPAYEPAPRNRFYETESTITKRSHEETFGRDDRPLFNGMRPDIESYPDAHRKSDSYPCLLAPNKVEGEYRRANGSTRRRLI